jgi:hypothetical protein
MEVIKELCAFLPKVNPRGVWEQFGIREYLSTTHWTIREEVVNEDTGYCDFWLEHVKPGFPGRLQVRTNWTATELVGVYWAQPGGGDRETAQQYALFRDLIWTQNMVGQLGRPSMKHYPDAGSW